MISQENLKSLVSYNAETGAFTRLVDLSSSAKAGALVAKVRPDGYLRAMVAGSRMMLHRMAFLYMTGSIPSEVDHINGDKADNRWANLRAADRLLNMQNIRRAPKKKSRSGILGAHIDGNKFSSSINVRGKVLHLGRFDTADAAQAAYIAAKRIHHPGCTL